jgi:hypothetical protein
MCVAPHSNAAVEESHRRRRGPPVALAQAEGVQCIQFAAVVDATVHRARPHGGIELVEQLECVWRNNGRQGHSGASVPLALCRVIGSVQKQWVIPPDASAAFVAGMKDVLEVYQRPRDPEYPVVCLDETSKQLVSETRVPIPAKPGQPARRDYEYERNGTANLFMIFAPLEGWRHVEVTDRHTGVD